MSNVWSQVLDVLQKSYVITRLGTYDSSLVSARGTKQPESTLVGLPFGRNVSVDAEPDPRYLDFLMRTPFAPQTIIAGWPTEPAFTEAAATFPLVALHAPCMMRDALFTITPAAHDRVVSRLFLRELGAHGVEHVPLVSIPIATEETIADLSLAAWAELGANGRDGAIVRDDRSIQGESLSVVQDAKQLEALLRQRIGRTSIATPVVPTDTYAATVEVFMAVSDGIGHLLSVGYKSCDRNRVVAVDTFAGEAVSSTVRRLADELCERIAKAVSSAGVTRALIGVDAFLISDRLVVHDVNPALTQGFPAYCLRALISDRCGIDVAITLRLVSVFTRAETEIAFQWSDPCTAEFGVFPIFVTRPPATAKATMKRQVMMIAAFTRQDPRGLLDGTWWVHALHSPGVVRVQDMPF